MSDNKQSREPRQADAEASPPARRPAAPTAPDEPVAKQDGLLNRGADPAEGRRD